MPTFTVWEQDLEVHSPLRIAFHQLGTIQRTRCYVPAATILGAWAAAWARSGTHGPGTAAYPKALAAMKQSLRFGYAFVCRQNEFLRPAYSGAGLHFGSIPALRFESQFLLEQASAALSADTLSAADGQLHESEALWRPNLRLRGYVLANGDFSWPDLLAQAGHSVRLGADRSYGWGQVTAATPRPLAPADLLYNQFLPTSFNQVQPLESPSTVPAHLVAARTAEGDLEFFGGREWNDAGAGQHIRPPALCWTPGTRLPAGSQSFEIDDRGVWQWRG